MKQCPNCGGGLTSHYCPQCGQRDVNLERPLLDLLREVFHETFDFDGRAARTLSTLFRHPGQLTARFLAGERRKYTPPFRLYLVISLIFFVVIGWVTGRGYLVVQENSAHDNLDQQVRFVSDDLPKLMFLLLPVFALILKAAYRQRLYFDHLIHALHLHSVIFVLLALMLPLENAANQNLFLVIVQFVIMIWLIAYTVVSFRRVYATDWLPATGKAVAILAAYVILLAMSFEVTSHLSLPSNAGLPVFTD